MTHDIRSPRLEKPSCTCANHYLCIEANWLLELIDQSEKVNKIGHARLFAMILCAHRRIEIRRITRSYGHKMRLPYYGNYLLQQNRIFHNEPTIESND